MSHTTWAGSNFAVETSPAKVGFQWHVGLMTIAPPTNWSLPVPIAPLENVPESAYELGELERDFPVSRVELWFNVLSISVLSVVFAAMVLSRIPNLLAPQTVGDFACIAIGVLFSIGGIVGCGIVVLKAYRNRHVRVLVFTDGFVCFRPDEVIACRWDAIAWTATSFAQSPGVGSHELTIHQHSGVELKLSQATELIKDFPALIATVERKVAEQLMPAALAELDAGETLNFGAMELTPEGISVGERQLPWAEIASIHEEQGHRITVEKKGAWTTWAAVHIGGVPNKRLLLEIARIRGSKVTFEVAFA